MKLSDYQPIIDKLSNPDTAAEGLVDLDTQLKADEAEFGKIQESNNALRDTNSRLALRITAPPTQQNNVEEDNVGNFDAWRDSMSSRFGGVAYGD